VYHGSGVASTPLSLGIVGIFSSISICSSRATKAEQSPVLAACNSDAVVSTKPKFIELLKN
jgi:hypothetical protein